jgi:hypothetical protein
VHAQPAGKRWAWPTTLQEAKPKAGTVVRKKPVDADLIDTGDADRPRERSPEAGSNRRTSGSAAFQICRISNQAARPPRRKISGSGRESINWHVGPDEQKCSLMRMD